MPAASTPASAEQAMTSSPRRIATSRRNALTSMSLMAA
jgi:hypothetical protein